MTIDEAIKELKLQSDTLESMILYNQDFNSLVKDLSLTTRKNAIDMAIEALEKQIPKKPTFEGDGYWNGQLVYDTWICPNCEKDYEVDLEEYDYCPKCGQAIDWREEE